MGNCMSTPIKVAPVDTCFICWIKIPDGELTTCNHCNIIMHKQCEETYRIIQKYTHCPHCQRTGTLCILYND